MSVYIKGMEMPTSCWECRFNASTIDHHEACLLTKKTYNWGLMKPPSDCPIVPVPKHGRLIDADALMGVIRAHDYPLKAHFNSTDNGMFTIGIQQAVDEAPTIIPAEEDK